MNNKILYIGDINYNISCGCNNQQYPYGLIMFGTYHKQCEDKLTGVKLIIDNVLPFYRQALLVRLDGNFKELK